MVYKFFDKKIEWEIIVNEQLAEELYKPVIKRFKKKKKKEKENSKFKDNIWEVDLAEMESFSSKNKNVKYLLCVIDSSWVKPLKDKKGKTVLNAFIEIVNESNSKPSKLWFDQGKKNYYISLRKNG